MIKTGRQYLDSLRDDREIWMDGERVRDVTLDPRFKDVAASIAELYDLQHRPELQEKLTYAGADGKRYGLSYIEPKSQADLVRRREMVKTWMDWTGGMMGRSPDFMNVHMTGFGSGSEYFARGGEKFGKNIRNYYEYLRENDLALTHTLINPQTDRSKPVHQQNTAAAVVKETDAGIIIHGARMIATLAPFSNDIAVFPSTFLQLSEEAKPYAFAFSISVATKGLRFICRPAITPVDARVQDYPFSARMDEMDCVAIFDNVLVPWERVFVYQNPKLGNGMFIESGCMNQIMHQFAIKNLAKAEFLLGVALNMSEAVGINGFQHVQNYIHEMINTVELVRSCIRASEADCIPGLNGTVLPHDQPLLTVRTLFPQLYPRLVEIIQILGASGLVMVPGSQELTGERAADIERYYQGANIAADKRIQLFRIAWDVSCSSFAGRQTLYERYFSGDPWRLGMMRYQNYPLQNELKQRIWDFARRTAEWDARASEESHVTA
ncbi:MAG: 4-hydroxyphenylacetate 3-monooxygenase, oxygenase component [Candidatus Angelobacter sp. Gp1-AA117]|nr:MAG: 4-hydroxyphenylacetate 3-monooxygenase, oxygenase component [Candidatus Angelobacter sp. Gp1-AA117]